MLGAYVVLSLIFFKPAFVAARRGRAGAGLGRAVPGAAASSGMNAAIVPIVDRHASPSPSARTWPAASVPVVFSTTSVLLASLALTVLAALIWRMPKGANGYVTRRRRQPDDHRLRADARLLRRADAGRGDTAAPDSSRSCSSW